MKSYAEVIKMPSSSREGKFYTISKDELGQLSCNCPSWCFKSNTNHRRFCKHIQEYWERIMK